ncbi:hypothetical protein ACIOTN_17065 [Glutamicibacter sp. NPDC087661]|uniref:hypothetical protein n=1 Tax=Glutamicibacter sp. NPDC087661 TaxID=3363996 RepID=UPI003818CCAD
MGANGKHESTYHGGEFTPDTATIRTFYTSDTDGNPIPGRAAQFNRWLETVRAEAKTEALNEVANAFQYKAWNELIQGSLQDRLRVAQPITAWLRARANQSQEEK